MTGSPPQPAAVSAGTLDALGRVSIASVPMDSGLPVTCAGVLAMPGDVMCGDGEGVLVVPAAMADDVAAGALQLEREERYITSRVAEGLSLDGLYPLGPPYRDDYEQWLRKQDAE